MNAMYRSILLGFIAVTVFGSALTGMVDPASAQTPPADTKPPEAANDKPGDQAGQRFVSIDFNNVDIHVFVKFISELTGRNFVVDDKVKGKVTVISPAKISEEEAYKVFESVLEVHGYATVPAGEVIKIVPIPDARTKNVETFLRDTGRAAEDKLVTQIIPLKYADANEIKRLLAPLIDKSSIMLAYEQTNMLIITDVYSNIKRLMRIIKAIDVTGIGREISIIPLQSADAVKLVKMLETIFKAQTAGKKTGADLDSSKFVADERTNTIVLLASEVDTLRVKRLIEMLDKEVPKGKEKIHVYYLEYAVAEDMAKVLLMLPSKQEPAATKGKKVAPVVSEKAKIAADKATNSLIIMADKDDYLALEEIIKKLDIPRAMVYIECLIMEVNLDTGFSLGTEWTVGGEGSYDGKSYGVGGGFSGSSEFPYSRIGNVLAGQGLPAGASMGVFGESITINGVEFPTLSAIVQATQNEQGITILSTPQIITTDNEEAKINVGRNVPFLTRTGTTSSSETYQNFEYKDVGKTLTVTPQISKDKLVRLAISLEVTSLDTAAIQSLPENQTTPVTFKRTVDTTVIMDNGSTVVIGGLIDDSLSKTKSHIPCLSDIPMLGWMFKNIAESTEKTNLYVFLTPHVIKSPAEAEKLQSERKKDIEKAMKEGKIKMYRGEGAFLENSKTDE